MRVKIENILEEPTLFEIEEEMGWARTAANEALDAEVLALNGALSLSLHHETLFVRGELQTKCRRKCDRCGVFLILEIEGPVDLAYRPEFQSSEAIRELSNYELDVGFYTDGAFEVADAVREHLALQSPFQLNCELPGATLEKEDCQAIVLEEKKEDEVDPRFAILKELKFDN